MGRGGGGWDGEMKGSNGCSKRVDEGERGEKQRLGGEIERNIRGATKNWQNGDKSDQM